MTDYYHNHFKSYHEKTFSVDPSSFLIPLIQRLSTGAKILDVGCGSGRDLLWLKNHGFEPVGFERSPGLSRLARKYSCCHVIEGDFENYDFSSLYADALIMIGSLVHIPHADIPKLFATITTAIRPKGFVLITLKQGCEAQIFSGGRKFYLWRDSALQRVFNDQNFCIKEFFKQASIVRPEDIWLGYVLQKSD